MMKIIQQSQHKPAQIGNGEPMIATPWQQYRTDDVQPLTTVFCYVVVLYSRQNREIWICDITSSSPNELVVVSYIFLTKYLFYCILKWGVRAQSQERTKHQSRPQEEGYSCFSALQDAYKQTRWTFKPSLNERMNERACTLRNRKRFPCFNKAIGAQYLA